MQNNKQLTDESIMPFGRYKGDRLKTIPASYLIWLYENNKCNKDLNDYIEDNLDVLKLEIKNESKK